MDVQEGFNQFIAWCKQYWYVLVLIALVLFLVWLYVKKKPSVKPLAREPILRNSFINRNKLNKSPISWGYRGDRLLGHIETLNAVKVPLYDKNKDTGEFIDAIELVIKPQLFNIKGIPDFLGVQKFCIVVNKDNADYDLADNWFNIAESTTFDKRAGVYYDRENKESYIKYIHDRLVVSDDYESTISDYYVLGQQIATLDTSAIATDIQKEQLRLESEKERRKHLVS